MMWILIMSLAIWVIIGAVVVRLSPQSMFILKNQSTKVKVAAIAIPAVLFWPVYWYVIVYVDNLISKYYG